MPVFDEVVISLQGMNRIRGFDSVSGKVFFPNRRNLVATLLTRLIIISQAFSPPMLAVSWKSWIIGFPRRVI